MSGTEIWSEWDRQQEGTPYWNHITDARFDFKQRLIALLKTYPILYPGKEFIMFREDAIRLVDDLRVMGIIVNGVGVWCSVPQGSSREECCPEGLGGPANDKEWFTEYVHWGYFPEKFDDWSHTLDLAERCCSGARTYLETTLPNSPGYNDRLRVSPHLYIPLMWELFPDYKRNGQA